ncbi:host specificity protein, partial [Enterobacter mori]
YRARLIDRIGNAGDWTDWIMGTSSIDVSEITNDILEDMKESETFKDLIENAVDSNEKIAGMADEIKNHADELEQQAKDILENADGLAQAEVKIDEISVSMDGMTGGVKNSAIAIIQNGLAQVATRKRLSATVAGNSAQLDRIDEVIVNEKEAT